MAQIAALLKNNLLSLLVWLPIFGGMALLIMGRFPRLARITGMLVALLTLALCIPLWTSFDPSIATFQRIEQWSWIPPFAVYYALGVDGFSMPLVVLSTFFTPLIFLTAWKVVTKRPHHYFGAFLILQGLMCGVFAALDAVLFYVFFEGMLIPMFLLIGIWGGPNRVYATLKFFLFTFMGSIFLLASLLYLHWVAGLADHNSSFSIAAFSHLTLSLTQQTWLFFGLLIAFAVKIPMWPVHTWLPDAHVEAPTGGSVILAAVLLKIGGYGLLRFILPITPLACVEYDWIVIMGSLIAIVYVGLVALVQKDMKKLIAYSSIAHMGFVTLGAFLTFSLLKMPGRESIAVMGIQGAYIQMISHGFISAAMFFCVGVLYDRMHSRLIEDYKGVANVMPSFAFFFVLFALANSGLPGTSGFVGEFMVILAAFQMNPWYAVLAALTLILGAAYTLWMVKRVLWGEVLNAQIAALRDITLYERMVLGTLAVAVIAFGVYPQPLFEISDVTVQSLVRHIAKHP